MITWGLCALPPAAGLAGRHSLCRIWGGCDCWACIWKCHKNTLTFARASLRLLTVLIILDWALSVLPYTQFSMDTNILPGVSLLVLPISKHLDVSAKVGWFCHLRRSSGIWVSEPCSTIWSSACYSLLGLIILGFLWEPEHLFVRAAVTLGSYCCFLPRLVSHLCNEAQRRLFCFVFVHSQGICDPDITLIRPFFFFSNGFQIILFSFVTKSFRCPWPLTANRCFMEKSQD